MFVSENQSLAQFIFIGLQDLCTGLNQLMNSSSLKLKQCTNTLTFFYKIYDYTSTPKPILINPWNTDLREKRFEMNMRTRKIQMGTVNFRTNDVFKLLHIEQWNEECKLKLHRLVQKVQEEDVNSTIQAERESAWGMNGGFRIQMYIQKNPDFPAKVSKIKSFLTTILELTQKELNKTKITVTVLDRVKESRPMSDLPKKPCPYDSDDQLPTKSVNLKSLTKIPCAYKTDVEVVASFLFEDQTLFLRLDLKPSLNLNPVKIPLKSLMTLKKKLSSRADVKSRLVNFQTPDLDLCRAKWDYKKSPNKIQPPPAWLLK